jgi:hypothetical protein
MNKALTMTQKIAHTNADFCRGTAQNVNDTFLGAARMRGCLGQANQSPFFTSHDKIGERASHINANAVLPNHIYPFWDSQVFAEQGHTQIQRLIEE